MKKNVFFSLLMILSVLSAFSQEAGIKGVIKDASSKDSLSFATVLIQSQKDSTIYSGQITDKKGTFSFQNLVKGSYSVRVTNIGYSDKTITVDLKEPSSIINIGSILLSPSEALLSAVTITGQKPKMVNQLEMQVFQAAQFQNAKGANALEVLRNLPSIAINAQGEITYRGAKGFLLLVNGTPTYADPITILGQLGANNIENIELITAPSARYDADGKAGIINIMTKKAITNSSSLLLDFQVGLPRVIAYENSTEPQRYGGNITYAVKQNKWEVALSGNFQKNDMGGRRIGDVNTVIDNIQTFFPSEGERSFKKYNYAFRGQTSHNFNSQSNISFGAYHGRKNQFRLADKILVLDEFDKSLEIGFESDMRDIVNTLSALEIKILTSATSGIEIPKFLGLKNPLRLDFLKENESKLKIKMVNSPSKDKLETLEKVLKSVEGEPGIVFCNYKDNIQYVSDYLNQKGIAHGCFFGGMEQQDRERALIKFRNGTHQLIIATDLAARGLDIPELRFIIHYQLPNREEEFIHRNGRTARMNAEGTAFVIAYPKSGLPHYMVGFPVSEIPKVHQTESTNWATVFVSAGRGDKISKGDIAGYFMKVGGLGKDEIGSIELKQDCAFVGVLDSKADELITKLNNTKLKTKKVRMYLT